MNTFQVLYICFFVKSEMSKSLLKASYISKISQIQPSWVFFAFCYVHNNIDFYIAVYFSIQTCAACTNMNSSAQSYCAYVSLVLKIQWQCGFFPSETVNMKWKAEKWLNLFSDFIYFWNFCSVGKTCMNVTHWRISNLIWVIRQKGSLPQGLIKRIQMVTYSFGIRNGFLSLLVTE